MIRFDHVTKSYSGTSRPALNDVSLEIRGGEFVFLVGASGSGKSSFLRLVLKEERATKGDVHVLGRHLNTLAARKVPFFRRSLGVVFQDFRLLPQKTVFDNVAFTLQVIGKSKGFIQEAVPDVLRLVGLAGKESRLPHELSGGEQQRVAIARAVVNKPAVLLADEPTGNLDPATSAGIMNLLSTINANGTTVVMATHDVGIVDEMRRRVIELVGGQVVRDEHAGGYQTQAVPVQRGEELDDLDAFDVLGGIEESAAEAVDAEAAPDADDDLPTARDDAPDDAPATDHENDGESDDDALSEVDERTVFVPRGAFSVTSDDHAEAVAAAVRAATASIPLRSAPPAAPVAAPPASPARSASPDSPPPLNEPEGLR